MLKPEIVFEIRRLLEEGILSQRRIAVATGVSRATVGVIARGTRPNRVLIGLRPYEPSRPARPPERCPRCRLFVYLPCRVCAARAARGRQQNETVGAGPPRVRQRLPSIQPSRGTGECAGDAGRRVIAPRRA